MVRKRKEFESKGFDEESYNRYYRQNQSEYIRKKLRCVKSYHLGASYISIASVHKLNLDTVRSYMNAYLLGGFELLCSRIKRPKRSRLSKSQEAQFRDVILNASPEEVGLEGNIWTGELMCLYLKQRFNIEYKSGIYDLLERMNLSHQKAHSDYGNAEPDAQRRFQQDLVESLVMADSETAIVCFDEFSICEKPSSFYAWAEKNTRPKVKTNEKKEKDATDS